MHFTTIPKLLIVLLALGFFLFCNLSLFVFEAPYANTASYNTTVKTKANFVKRKSQNRRFSFQITNKDRKKKVINEKFTIFFLHGLPGSRLFSHPEEKKFLMNLGAQLIRFDRPGMGFSTSVERSKRFSAVVEDIIHTIKILKLKEGLYGFVGFGFGSPYAIELAKRTGAKLSLISPVGKFNDENVVKESLPYLRQFINLKERYGYRVPVFAIKAYAQLGMLCDRDTWHKNLDKVGLFTPEEFDIFTDYEEDDDWSTMLNDTMVEFFRDGVDGLIEELLFAISPEWSSTDIPNFGSEKLRIFRGGLDPICVTPMIDNMIEEMGLGEGEIGEILKKNDSEGHFSTFMNRFEKAIEFVVGDKAKKEEPEVVEKKKEDEVSGEPEGEPPEDENGEEEEEEEEEETEEEDMEEDDEEDYDDLLDDDDIK